MPKSLLKALCELYERLEQDPDSGVALRGYSMTNVAAEIALSRDGEVRSIVDLRNQLPAKGKKKGGPALQKLKLPMGKIRTSNVASNYCYDTGAYVFGIGQDGKEDHTRRCFDDFARYHRETLASVDDDGARALLRFIDRRVYGAPDSKAMEADRVLLTSAMVFRLDGDECRLHERPAIRSNWERLLAESLSEAVVGECMVTGEIGPIARLHPRIKGLSKNVTSLVNFQASTFCFDYKEQGLNAPISEKAAFEYSTALNWLIAQDRHKMRIGQVTYVFWGESDGDEEDVCCNFLRQLGGQTSEVGSDNSDSAVQSRDSAAADMSQEIRELLEAARAGRPLKLGARLLDKDKVFYMIGLEEKSHRIIVRDWHESSLGALLRNIAAHIDDMAIVVSGGKTIAPQPFWRIAREVGASRYQGEAKDEDVAAHITEGLTKAALFGAPYPEGLFRSTLHRMKIPEKDLQQKKINNVTPIRVGMLKAFLNRRARILKEDEVNTVSLDTDRNDIGYLLGRLFAILERLQRQARPGINETIKDTDFKSACTRPQAIFPRLLAKSRFDAKALDSEGSRVYFTKLIQGVLRDIDEFPVGMNAYNQARFMIGYYHQTDAMFQKNGKGDETNV